MLSEPGSAADCEHCLPLFLCLLLFSLLLWLFCVGGCSHLFFLSCFDPSNWLIPRDAVWWCDLVLFYKCAHDIISIKFMNIPAFPYVADVTQLLLMKYVTIMYTLGHIFPILKQSSDVLPPPSLSSCFVCWLDFCSIWGSQYCCTVPWKAHKWWFSWSWRTALEFGAGLCVTLEMNIAVL